MNLNIFFSIQTIVLFCLFFVGTAINNPMINNDQAGRYFIFSLPSNTTKSFLYSWLKKTKPAGVMLQSEHCRNRKQTKKLVTLLQYLTKKLTLPPLIIAIDWEGGIVTRASESNGFFSIPSPWLLSKTQHTGCFLAGMLVGQQLKSCGITMNFAPLFDLFTPYNQILATRCFSSNEYKVYEYGNAFAHGLMVYGITPVIKHFPGIATAAFDTHISSAKLIDEKNIFDKHIFPFLHALKNGAPAIMVSHTTSPFLDNTKPLSLSPNTINIIKKYNPRATCITDDFSMNAINNKLDPQTAAKMSIDAGFDLIIFSAKPDVQIDLIQKLNQQLPFKQKTTALRTTISHNQHMPTLHESSISTYLTTLCLQNELKNIPNLNGKKIILCTINLPAIRPSENWFICNNISYFGNTLKNHNLLLTEHIINHYDNNVHHKITTLLKKYAIDQNTIFIFQLFLYGQGKWNDVQNALLEHITSAKLPALIISLGHPIQQKKAPYAKIINLGSFHKPLINYITNAFTRKPILLGGDILIKNPSQYLKNKKFGILCNNTSYFQPAYQKYQLLPDILYNWAHKQHDSTKLIAVFAPEHGFFGSEQAGKSISSQTTSIWGCPIYSLYGTHKTPDQSILSQLDVIIIDLPDVGTRCFTYLSTINNIINAAKKAAIPVIVLNRLNPLPYQGTFGPFINPQYKSFIGTINTQFIHGKTIGIIARNNNPNVTILGDIIPASEQYNAFLHKFFFAPSPNLSSVSHICAYPITVFLEGTNYSEGRGTKYPFLQYGAPWVDKNHLAATLNAKKISGIFFEPITFKPKVIPGKADNPKYVNMVCHGIFIHIYDHTSINPTDLAYTILETLFTLYPTQSKCIKSGNRYLLDLLLGNSSWRNKIIKKQYLSGTK